jgi:hypothetical protein
MWMKMKANPGKLVSALALLLGLGLCVAPAQAGPGDKGSIGRVMASNAHSGAANADGAASVFVPGSSSAASVSPATVIAVPAAAPAPTLSAIEMRRQEMRNAVSAKPATKTAGDVPRRQLSTEERVHLRTLLRQDLRAQDDGAVAKR